MSDKRNKFSKTVLNSAIIRNPVLFEAVGIAPVVAIAVSLKSAIIVSVVSAVELIIIEMFACLLLKRLKKSIRMPIYAILGMSINIPLYMLCKFIIPNETASAGIFLPLIAVNSLIALHCERFAVRHKASETFTDAISAGASYAFVVLIIGTIREVLGNGSVYGISLNLPLKLSGLLMPFGGFLMLGFMAAALKSIINKKYPDAKPEMSFDLSEISQSHIVGIRRMIDDELNLYGETDDDPTVDIEKDRAKKEKPAKKEKFKPEKSVKAKKPKKQKKAKKSKDPESLGPDSSAAKRSEEIKPKQTNTRDISDNHDNYLKEFEDILSELQEYKSKTITDEEAEEQYQNQKGGDDE